MGPQTALGGVEGVQGIALRTGVAALSGGVATAISGGKFANGAVTAAFFHLFNAESEKIANSAMRYSGFFGTVRSIWEGNVISRSLKEGTTDWGNMTYDMFTPGTPLADSGAYDANAGWVPYSRAANVGAAGSLMVAGGAAAWTVAGGPTMSVAVGEGTPFHVWYGSQGTMVHAAGSRFFHLTVSQLSLAEMRLWGSRAWLEVTQIPVRYSSSVTATGQNAWTCATSAVRSFFRGWFTRPKPPPMP